MTSMLWHTLVNQLQKHSPERLFTQLNPGKSYCYMMASEPEHDPVKSDRSLTVEALPLIIEQLQAEGYKIVTVPELLNVPAYNEVLR